MTVATPEFATMTREQVRERCRTDLHFLCQEVLGYRDIDTALHRDMCEQWQRRANRPYSLWLVPRGHLKTSLWTIGGNIQRILCDPDTTILIYFHKIEMAMAKLREMRAHFESNATFRWAFPEFCPPIGARRLTGLRWTDHAFEVPCRTRRVAEATVQVAAVGASAVGIHVHHIHFDDVVDDLNSRTAELREKVSGAILDAFQYRVSPTESTIGVVGTIWHYADFYSTTRRAEEKHRKAGNAPEWLIYHRRVEEGGVPIWPARFPQHAIDALKRKLGPVRFNCQYYCEPLTDVDTVLRWDRVQTFKDADCQWFAAAYMRSGKPDEGPEDVVVLAGLDRDHRLHVRHILKGFLTPASLLEHLRFLKRTYGFARVLVDEQFYDATLHTSLYRAGNADLLFSAMKRPASSHCYRILALESAVNRAGFLVHEACDFLDELHAEFDQMSVTGSAGSDDILALLAEVYANGSGAAAPSEPPPGPGTFAAAFGDPETEPEAARPVDRVSRWLRPKAVRQWS